MCPHQRNCPEKKASEEGAFLGRNFSADPHPWSDPSEPINVGFHTRYNGSLFGRPQSFPQLKGQHRKVCNLGYRLIFSVVNPAMIWLTRYAVRIRHSARLGSIWVAGNLVKGNKPFCIENQKIKKLKKSDAGKIYLKKTDFFQNAKFVSGFQMVISPLKKRAF